MAGAPSYSWGKEAAPSQDRNPPLPQQVSLALAGGQVSAERLSGKTPFPYPLREIIKLFL